MNCCTGDTDWVSVGIQTPSKDSDKMVFKNVPPTLYYIGVPEYSSEKRVCFFLP